MVRVTEQAATELQGWLAANNAPPEAGVRLVPDGTGGLGMAVDAPRAGDEVVERNESPVLIMEGAVAQQLTDMEVDYQSAADNHQTSGGFVLRRRED